MFPFPFVHYSDDSADNRDKSDSGEEEDKVIGGFIREDVAGFRRVVNLLFSSDAVVVSAGTSIGRPFYRYSVVFETEGRGVGVICPVVVVVDVFLDVDYCGVDQFSLKSCSEFLVHKKSGNDSKNQSENDKKSGSFSGDFSEGGHCGEVGGKRVMG